MGMFESIFPQVVEIAPAVQLDPHLRDRLHADAVNLARQVRLGPDSAFFEFGQTEEREHLCDEVAPSPRVSERNTSRGLSRSWQIFRNRREEWK